MSPWVFRAAQVLAVAIGVALMAAPSVAGYAHLSAADAHRIIGPIAVAAAFVSLSFATRGVRRVNVLAGTSLAIMAVVGQHPAPAATIGIAAGILLAVLGLIPSPRGPAQGGGWSALAH